MGNSIANNPSVVYSLVGNGEMGGHAMIGVGHPAPSCNKECTSSTFVCACGRFDIKDVVSNILWSEGSYYVSFFSFVLVFVVVGFKDVA